MRPITRRQRECLAFIRLYRLLVGESPTYREIARVMRVALHAAYDHVSRLVRKGYLIRETYTPRGFYPREEVKNDGNV